MPLLLQTTHTQTNHQQDYRPSDKCLTSKHHVHHSESTTKATPPSTPQCGYTVTPVIWLRDQHYRHHGNYSMNISEEGQPGKTHHHQLSNQELISCQFLKPCTEYEHHVAFVDHVGKETPCNSAEDKTRTIEMNKDDIKNGSCTPGYVCYHSDWDISTSLSASNNIPAEPCKSDQTTFCIKPGFNDICSDLTTTFTCGNTSFNFTKSIGVDFLNLSEIIQKPPTKLPAKIEPTLPNCLTVNYTCLDGKSNEFKDLSELEPFTQYNCTGQIKENNVSIEHKTIAINVKIECDLDIRITNEMPADTSIVLSWTNSSKNCPYPHLQKLSYDCSCWTSSQWKPNDPTRSKGQSCNISGLKPFTDYTCKVQPTYNNKNVSKPKEVKYLKTAAGKPDNIQKLRVEHPDHNVITVTCDRLIHFNGPEKIYIASLYETSDPSKKPEEERNNECKFTFSDLRYSTSYNLTVTAFNGKHRSKLAKSEIVETYYNNKAVIGFLVFLIILTSVALLLVIYKIYILKRRQSHDMSENMMLISTTNDEENLLPVEPIAAEVLLEAYKRKLADEGRLFLAEFQSIPRIFSRYTVKEAKKPCNVPKNRYVDILPYDYNRVQLTTGNGEAGCDYINASFIDGYKESKKYIAAQGPKDETVGDFWRMVWEQQSSIIVMVTRCEEGNRVKCAQYWPTPDRDTEIFEEFIVKLNSEDQCPDYTIRRLSLTNKRDKNSEREVTHIQFMSWPDHGVPGEPHLLLKLRRRVNAFKNFFSGPIVVHCSAGVGRTGTYIGIDAMMEGLEAEGRVDIYGYVVRLRRQRCLMVQVEAQYILIHQALLEHNQFGETEITLPELHGTLSTLKQSNSGSEPTLMEEEFDRLPTYRNWRTSNTGITEENKNKNRSSSVIPYDYNRVLLKLDEGHSRDSDPDEDDEEESSDEEDEESTKYINASHIDGYWGPRAFIVAQTPLPDTMADFWSMVYQKKVSTIIMLSDYSEGDKESDCVYWDKDKKTFGECEVEVTSTDTSPTFVTRNMLIRHVKRKESRPVKQFQLLKWGSGEVPEKPQDLTDMIKGIKNSCGSSKSQRNIPIVVHCNDGSSRSGIFCALWNVLDSAETEKLVDVFQVVKTLRKERQGMLSGLEQYQFLYDALEGVFPVQNGDVKAGQVSAVIEVVNETKAAEEKAEQPASSTPNGQQVAAETTPVADGEKENKKEEPEKVSSAPTETSSEDTSKGAILTVEV
ncbi:receptor-type tyrosine-protein phosphatase C isoform X4 [Larimichthys crocea]|uniref:receptor-type tyrosine-protein phosphatase C isoform X4 n=1 Tax=Larimichthys crocea TaxID=215358 RepID=UPI000F5D7630|nr:receptor-type tyrosine-protein phosphatase C isoform X4 [Larimichthys crocea]